jgi:hypothetical protein
MGKRAAIKEIPLAGKVAYGMLAAALPLAFFLGRADHGNHADEKSGIPADVVPGVPLTEGSPGIHLPTPSASDADEAQNAPESPVVDENTQPADEDTKAPHKPAQGLAEAKASHKPDKHAKATSRPSKTVEPTKAPEPKQTAKPKEPVKPKPKQTAKPESNKGPLTAFIEDTTGISVPDALNPLHMFLARVSDEPLAVSYDEAADTVTMTAVLTDETAVQVEVTGAEECSRKDPATITAQTVDPQTEEPTGEPVTVDVTNPDNLSSTGIAAAVTAVLTDAEEPRQSDTSSD